MKASSILVLIVFCIASVNTAFSQRYAVGDIVDNFTLINRATNQPVRLSDLEGNIVFLEWFAYWCPFCQAAAADVETGIVEYYKNRSGNAAGIPVLHVGINLQGGAESLTQAFIDRYGLGLVLNDFNRNLANRFQSGGQPIFAIINGVKNSASHDQWELIYSRLGYGDFTQPIATFRQAIDSVQAAPSVSAPEIASQPRPARLGTGSTLELAVSATGEGLSYQWLRDGSPVAGQTASTLTLTQVTLEQAGSYSVRVSNAGGEALSSVAEVEVVRSLADYLAQFGLAGEDLSQDADPDGDGYPNAIEYLAQTNPRDPLAVPRLTLRYAEEGEGPALRLAYHSSSETIGYQLMAQFWAYPAEAGSVTHVLPLGVSGELIQAIPAAARTYLSRIQASPVE